MLTHYVQSVRTYGSRLGSPKSPRIDLKQFLLVETMWGYKLKQGGFPTLLITRHITPKY